MKNIALRNLLIAAVVFAGLGVFIAGAASWDHEDLLLLGSLVALTVCSESADFAFPNSRISVTMALILAAGIFSGLPGVAVVAPVAAIADFCFHPKALYKSAFNAGCLVLAGASLVGVLEVFSSTYSSGDWTAQIGPVVVGSVIAFAVNSGLVSLVISLDRGLKPFEVWSDCFRWMLPHYVLLGLLGLFLAAAYDGWDMGGLVLLLAPLAIAWFYMKQHADRVAGARSVSVQPGKP